jgi:pyruvate dehydrogenase E1 component alpha subunit
MHQPHQTRAVMRRNGHKSAWRQLVVILEHRATMTSATAPTRHSLLAHLYGQMALIREFETEAERQYKAARIGGYCHVASGQEATTVGAVHALEDDDLLVTGYRCHGFALARGVTPEAVMAELFGRRGGCANGRGGSMHLLDVSRGFFGGWGIVAGQLPVATGLALALVRRGHEQAVLCELGDGAVNMGAWHESLNLAALWSLPIVFLIINNNYAMGTSVERASAEPELHRRACAFRMPGERVDGDDLDAVIEASERLMRAAREDRQPAVLEAVTYRYRGHSVADAGLSYRTQGEIDARKGKDPIALARRRLLAEGMSEDELAELERDVDERVQAAVAFASADEPPPVEELAVGMYAPGSAEQFSRMRPGSPFGELDLVFDGGLGL